jgi:hypothetical protein
VGAGALRLIVQPIVEPFELCARLGLVLVARGRGYYEGLKDAGIVHAVLHRSPCWTVGIGQRDIIISINNRPWQSVRYLTFSDRRRSEITIQYFSARYFVIAKIPVRLSPEPYRQLEEIVEEATAVIAASPIPDATPYQRPRDERRELMLEALLARYKRRSRRR